MKNIFSKHYHEDKNDRELILFIKEGNRSAFEALIQKHRGWIYNIALRMTGSSYDADDVTQEVLIKMMTGLESFKGNSTFRTWLYRIVKNHVLNMKRGQREELFSSFKRHSEILHTAPDIELPDLRGAAVDKELIIEETRVQCMMGMLLCLNREQRLAFILGAVFNAPSRAGSEIMEIKPAYFRKILSRARKDLCNYMQDNCGLVNSCNTCSCPRKTAAAVKAGHVDPDHLQFCSEYEKKVKDFVVNRKEGGKTILDIRMQLLFQEHPFKEHEKSVAVLKKVLNNKAFFDTQWLDS